MKDKIELFIKNNNIDLTGVGSDLNGQIVILVGYALYIGIKDYDTLENILLDLNTEVSSYTEIDRVFEVAEYRNYKKWWDKESNRNKFIL
jgi:hypothetical protein